MGDSFGYHKGTLCKKSKKGTFDGKVFCLDTTDRSDKLIHWKKFKTSARSHNQHYKSVVIKGYDISKVKDLKVTAIKEHIFQFTSEDGKVVIF
jgi:hypothetical protein